MAIVNPFRVDVRVNHDLNQMQDNISALVSQELALSINNKLLGEVCSHLFGTKDVGYIRDVFAVISQDQDVYERVLALRTARRIGVR